MQTAAPEPMDAFDLAMDDGVNLRIRRHGDTGARTRLFLSHGNGFAIDGYAAFWEPLLDRFELILFDHRNHGRNAPSDPAGNNYAQLSRDVETVRCGVTARYGAKPVVGAFHSMSGRAAMKHALEIGWGWDALVLFDPPNIPPVGHPVHRPMIDFERKLEAWARSRQERFAHPDELAGQYAATRANSGWVEGAHAAMARAVLRPEGGEWVLSCPPAVEADTYLANIPMNLWPRADEFGGPVKLIAADPDLPRPGPTALANRALAEENGYDCTAIPGAGHLLQVEEPAACREAMLAFLRTHAIAC